MKAILLNTILVILIAVFSLPFLLAFLAAYAFLFVAFGGGWAYAGPNGCHFVIGPIGYAMLIFPITGLAALGWKLLRGFRGL